MVKGLGFGDSLAHMGAQGVVEGGPVLAQQVAEVVVVGQVPDDGLAHLQRPDRAGIKGEFPRAHHAGHAPLREAHLLREGDVDPAHGDLRQAGLQQALLCSHKQARLDCYYYYD